MYWIEKITCKGRVKSVPELIDGGIEHRDDKYVAEDDDIDDRARWTQERTLVLETSRAGSRKKVVKIKSEKLESDLSGKKDDLAHQILSFF